MPTDPNVKTATKVTSEQGWHSLTHAMGRTMPKHLKAANQARRSLRTLTRGKGR